MNHKYSIIHNDKLIFLLFSGKCKSDTLTECTLYLSLAQPAAACFYDNSISKYTLVCHRQSLSLCHAHPLHPFKTSSALGAPAARAIHDLIYNGLAAVALVVVVAHKTHKFMSKTRVATSAPPTPASYPLPRHQLNSTKTNLFGLFNNFFECEYECAFVATYICDCLSVCVCASECLSGCEWV